MATNYQIVEIDDNYGRIHKIAVRPVSQHTTATRKDGPVTVPTMPGWVTQARDFRNQFGEARNFEVALKLLIKDMISEFASVQADRVRAYASPLRVSDTVHPGFFWIDAQGLITVNECWAKDRALDSDGDNAMLVYTKDRNAAYFIKYPLTQNIPKLYLQQTKVPDTWEDYRPELELWTEPRQLTDEELYEAFIKCHRQGEIGRKTNYWDARALFEAKAAGMNYWQTCCHLLDNPARFYDLEGDLKASRGGLGAKAFSYTQDIEEARYVVTDDGRWRLQGKPGTVDQMVLRQLIRTDWAQESRKEEVLGGLEINQLSSRQSAALPIDLDDIEDEEEERGIQSTYKQIDSRGRNFTTRLEELQVITWEDIPHQDPCLPPAQILSVWHRKAPGKPGMPVALHDTRRGGGMHQHWILPPVSVIKDGQVLWFKARDMLEQELATIRTDFQGNQWPQSHSAIEYNPEKANQLQTALQQFVGKYGIPSLKSNDFVTMVRTIATRAFTVIYGTIEPEEMWVLAQDLRKWFAVERRRIADERVIPKLQALLEHQESAEVPDESLIARIKLKLIWAHSDLVPGLTGGVKNSNKPWRRYLVADPTTYVPIMAPDPTQMASWNRCSPKRVGEIHSQASQAVSLGLTSAHDWKQQKIRLFIYGDGTKGQLYAFPSGQQKQDIPGVFMPQVSDRPDETHGITVPMSYRTLAGQDRINYVGEARPTIGCGKIISFHGMKNFCGVEEEQLYALIPGEGSVPVDFAISQIELMSRSIVDADGREWKGKGCLEAMLEQGNARNVTVQWPGPSGERHTVRGKLVEIQVMRTTTPSENVQPETRVRSISGVAKHAVRAAMMAPVREYGTIDTNDWLNWDDRAIADVNQPRLRKRDLRYLQMLQYAAQVVGSQVGVCDAPTSIVEVETLVGPNP